MSLLAIYVPRLLSDADDEGSCTSRKQSKQAINDIVKDICTNSSSSLQQEICSKMKRRPFSNALHWHRSVGQTIATKHACMLQDGQARWSVKTACPGLWHKKTLLA